MGASASQVCHVRNSKVVSLRVRHRLDCSPLVPLGMYNYSLRVDAAHF